MCDKNNPFSERALYKIVFGSSAAPPSLPSLASDWPRRWPSLFFGNGGWAPGKYSNDFVQRPLTRYRGSWLGLKCAARASRTKAVGGKCIGKGWKKSGLVMSWRFWNQGLRLRLRSSTPYGPSVEGPYKKPNREPQEHFCVYFADLVSNVEHVC